MRPLQTFLRCCFLLLALGAAAAHAQGDDPTAHGAPPPVTDASYKRKPAPVYPPESRAAGEQGRVTLAVTVDASGVPYEVKVLTSSGFPRLDAAAVEAGKAMLVNPVQVNGVPHATRVTVPINFALTPEGGAVDAPVVRHGAHG